MCIVIWRKAWSTMLVCAAVFDQVHGFRSQQSTQLSINWCGPVCAMKRKEQSVPSSLVAGCKCGKCDACEKENIEKAFILRDAIVNAFAWEKTTKLEVLVRQLISFNPSVAALAQTGIGRLLFDSELWKKMEPSSLVMLAAVKEKWKSSVDNNCGSNTASTTTKCSLVQLKAKSYMESVQMLQTWLVSLDLQPVELHIARRVAICFVNNGLTSWSHLDGLYASDLVVSNTLTVH